MKFLSALFVVSLLFLQEGFSYYLSFQVAALCIIFILFLLAKGVVNFGGTETMGLVAFLIPVFITSIISPDVVASNSTNVMLTFIALISYAAAIFFLPRIYFQSSQPLLIFLKNTSGIVILLLLGFLLISESAFISSLTREAMIEQNARLIDNATESFAIFEDRGMRLMLAESGRVDLFYGEPSFLAIVLFACLGCNVIASRVLKQSSDSSSSIASKQIGVKSINFAPSVAILMLLYVDSLSSVIYALVSIYFLFVAQKVKGSGWAAYLLLLICFSAIFYVFSYGYLNDRLLSVSGSGSLEQRFGFFLELDLVDIVTGVKDFTRLPEVGIHNGLLYIVVISGIGGLIYLLEILRIVFSRATKLTLGGFSVILILAIFAQNGGVFSPNKVVLFALVVLPLACAQTIPREKRLCPVGNVRK